MVGVRGRILVVLDGGESARIVALWSVFLLGERLFGVKSNLVCTSKP